MKFSVSLFLLFFMLQNTFSITDVRIVLNNGDALQMDYDAKTIMDSKQAYVFSQIESDYRSIIYVVGAQSNPYQKIMAAQHAALSVKQIVEEVFGSANIYFTRKTSDSLKTFGDVEKREGVFDKIPRLYRICTDGIIQIPLKPEFVNDSNSFVLHDGSTIAVYYLYSLSNETTEIAISFATYIADFQRTKYNVDTDISDLGVKKDLKEFLERIENSMNTLLHNKISSFLKNDAANFETINEELDAKINIADDEEDEEYEKLKTRLVDMLMDIIAEASDERISNSFTNSISLSSTFSASSSTASNFTASTSTDSARQNVKRETTRKGEKKLFMKSQSANVAAFPKNGETFILGPTECQAVKTYPFDAIKPTCVYVILDYDTNESFVYFGRYGRELDYKRAVSIAELFLIEEPFRNVSYIVNDDYPIPPFFLIYFKRELENNLGISFSE